MTDVQNTFTEEDVEWLMEWGENKKDKPPKEWVFEISMALGHLLLNEVIFLNDNHWEKTWPEDARKTVALCVGCNDIFAWACSDGETILRQEIETLYRLWLHSPTWGAAAWCIFKRKVKPQAPVLTRMTAAGWDIDWLITATKDEILAKFRKGPTDTQ